MGSNPNMLSKISLFCFLAKSSVQKSHKQLKILPGLLSSRLPSFCSYPYMQLIKHFIFKIFLTFSFFLFHFNIVFKKNLLHLFLPSDQSLYFLSLSAIYVNGCIQSTFFSTFQLRAISPPGWFSPTQF